MIIILAGAIGRFPVGGQAWCELQYLLGLRHLGHDVFFLEDCGDGSWVYNWETEQLTTDLDYPIQYVQDCLEPFGFGNQWIYRVGDRSLGMSLDYFCDICAQADLLLVRGLSIFPWRDEYDWPKRRIFIDSDPGFTQIAIANGHRELKETVERCERLFTIGKNLGAPDCPIPTLGKQWLKTTFSVFLPHWSVTEVGNATHFTSILQWRSYQEVTYQGLSYGNKNQSFPQFVDLPKLTQQPLCLALTGGFPEELTEHGWDVVSGWRTSWSPDNYQQFIQGSRAEFGIAKQGYVAMRGGWFSDRSICYLASGRPVLIQDTGQGDWLPTGKGVVTFRDVDEALEGIAAINADYEGHRQAARAIAQEYFATEVVLPPLLEAAIANPIKHNKTT